MLNPKQEKYVMNLIQGMSQRQAYKDAYNAKYSNKAIDEKASTLFNKEKVQARYNELIGELKDKAILSATERMKFLTKIVKADEKEVATTFKSNPDTGELEAIEKEYTPDLTTRMKAVDLLNKMDGQYTENINLTGDMTIRVDLTDDE